MNAQRILDYCRSISSSELREFAREEFSTVYNYITVYQKKPSKVAFDTILDCVGVCVALDRSFTRGEWELVKYVFRLTDDNQRAFQNVLETLTTIRKKREVSDFCHSLPPLQRKALVSVCIATMCSDNRFTHEDLDFLEDCLL